MNVLLIHNADAGDEHQRTPRELVELMAHAGHRVRDESIKTEGWSKCLEQPVDLVAVAGGDGTVGEVARRMVGRATPITVVPAGTANNIAKSLGFAEIDAPALIAGWSQGTRKRFDAGVAAGPWGTRYFVEGVGIGLFTQAMPWISHRQHRRPPQSGERRIANALQQLREHLRDTAALQLKAALDGRDISGRYILFEAMNTRYVGPNLFLAPDVEHGEGLLHVVGVTERDRGALDDCLADWKLGATWPADLGVHIGQRLEVEWRGFPVHLDDSTWPQQDEPVPTSPVPIVLTIERGALQFLVPEHEPRDRTRRGP